MNLYGKARGMSWMSTAGPVLQIWYSKNLTDEYHTLGTANMRLEEYHGWVQVLQMWYSKNLMNEYRRLGTGTANVRLEEYHGWVTSSANVIFEEPHGWVLHTRYCTCEARRISHMRTHVCATLRRWHHTRCNYFRDDHFSDILRTKSLFKNQTSDLFSAHS